MSAGPDTEATEQSSSGHGRRVAVLGTLAGIALLVGGFFIGRASEGEGSEPTKTTATTVAADKPPKQNNRACGHDAGPDAAAVVKVFPPMIVSDGAIDAEGKGSPGEALLEWWQAYQFSDVRAVEALTSQATIDAVGEENLTDLIQLPGPGLQGIEILDSSEAGSEATLETGLLTYAREPGEVDFPSKPTSSAPETFTMTKEGGEWLFASPEFLIPKLTALN